VLSIGKLGQGQEQYYLQAVAQGAEDYYVYAGEAPGQWAGGGAASLGLTAKVAGEHFTAVLLAQDPRTGQTLGRQQATGKVPGFDLTFSAPKSVSLLFALSDADLSRRMRDAHDAAVLDAFAYLERTASHGRRGHGGAERIPTTGFVGAVFRHRTSRAGDPNLHSHVVVANRVLGADGQWTALDARALYVQAKTAGTLYQASLRHQLRDLGLTWTVAPSGLAELDAVPADVRRAFSQRRVQIEQHMAARGLTRGRPAQTAALDTRAGKDATVDPDNLRHRWRERATALGFGNEGIAELLRRGRERPRWEQEQDLSVLLSARGLTAQASSFGERDVLRAVAKALQDGASVADVESRAAELLCGDGVVPLSPQEIALRGQDVLRRRTGTSSGRLVPMGVSERRFSTPELLALEEQLVASAVAGRGTGTVAADEDALQRALTARPGLSEEQVAMVTRLTRSPDLVSVVDAAAGAGKTTTLGAVAAAYIASGNRVVGTTLSAKAAGVLQDQTGIPTFTTARLLADLNDPQAGGLAPGSVVVVDEAGQVGSRTLAAIGLAVRRADGRLILVGDPHQLPEIDAGGAYRGLLNRLDTVELKANHRQVEHAEQARLLDLRRGDVGRAMASYDEAGRVTRAETSEDLREQLVQDWAQEYVGAGGEDLDQARAQVVMLGLTNADVDDLNERARVILHDLGLLGREELVVGDRGFRLGDHVVSRHNDRRVGVLNGQRWAVVGLGTEMLLLRPVGRTGAVVRLPMSYVQEHRGRLQHAYAITTSVSQGSSVDRAFVLGSDATYREAGYTAASRARQRTQFYVVTTGPTEAEEERPGAPRVQVDEQDPLAEFVAALSRSAAKDLAIDTRQVADPIYRQVDDEQRQWLLAARDRLRAALADAPPDPSARQARLQAEYDEAYQAQAAAVADRAAAQLRAPEARRLGLRRRPPSLDGRDLRQMVKDATQRMEWWTQRVEALETTEVRLQAQQAERLRWEEAHGPGLRQLAALDASLTAMDRDLESPSRLVPRGLEHEVA